MKYAELQNYLRPYKQAGISSIKLNAKKAVLENEYQRCLQQGLSSPQLQRRIAHHQKVKNVLQKQTLASLKARVYSITGLRTVQELRQNYPQIRGQGFNFRTKQAWQECLKIIAVIHQETLEFERFKAEIELRVEQYNSLRQGLGEDSSLPFQELLELKDVVSQYIPDTLSLTPQQQLMQAWLGQTLSTHNIQV
ncbi:MAG: hypothetical protein ACFB4I_11920 [Cyanophyceae cyanobacterium]